MKIFSMKKIYVLLALSLLLALLLCICVGSVYIPPKDIFYIISNAIRHIPQENAAKSSIILSVRIPRVLCAGLTGACLSLSGACMQGLLKNPLADGSTLGISSGASLGAVCAIAFGIRLPFLPISQTGSLSCLFAFACLFGILFLSYRLDHTLSSNTVILVGIVFSMFISSIISLILTAFPEKIKSITFWTFGSFSGTGYGDVAVLFTGLCIFGFMLLHLARELDAFSIGEETAVSVGVNTKKVRLLVMISSSFLVGLCVSISGPIGFVGLVTPHIIRLLTGPSHKKLLPCCLFGGAIFALLCDLLSRILFSPVELPIGTITSFVGTIVFLAIYSKRKLH